MAKRSNAQVQNAMLEALHTLHADMVQLRTDTNARLDGLSARVDGMSARLDLHGKALTKLVDEVHSLNGRFDNFLVTADERLGPLETRVERLEAAIYQHRKASRLAARGALH